MKKIILTALLAAAVSTAGAQQYDIPLWKDGPAESNGLTGPEEAGANGRVANISEASVAIWPAAAPSNGIAVVICPGGGYAYEATEHEGRLFAEWLSSQGVTAAVLKYRLPNGHPKIPVTDALRAVQVIREMAGELGVDPGKVGIAGFSAGGHLASTALTWTAGCDRPDFGILFYPVISMDERLTHGGSRANLLGKDPSLADTYAFSTDRQVDRTTPPTLIFFSEDDKTVDPQNGRLFYDALQQNGVRSRLVLFPDGGHGWGFNPSFAHLDEVKAEMAEWLKSIDK